MRTKQIRYWINASDGKHLVSGFAVDFPLVRFCVREKSDGTWICDHYDNGYHFGGGHASKDDAIFYGVEKLSLAVMNGKYAQQIKAHNRGEI